MSECKPTSPWLVELEEHKRQLRDSPEYRAHSEADRARAATANNEHEIALYHEQAVERRRQALAGVPLREHIETALVRGSSARLQITTALEVVSCWMRRNDVQPVLVLTGAAGCGKTVAAAFATALWASNNPLHPELPGWIRAGKLSEHYGRMRAAPLLVLDDVGSESEPGGMPAALLDLVDFRQHSARRFRTIIATHLSRADFLARYPDPRLESRMAPEAGIVGWIICPESDLRPTGP